MLLLCIGVSFVHCFHLLENKKKSVILPFWVFFFLNFALTLSQYKRRVPPWANKRGAQNSECTTTPLPPPRSPRLLKKKGDLYHFLKKRKFFIFPSPHPLIFSDYGPTPSLLPYVHTPKSMAAEKGKDRTLSCTSSKPSPPKICFSCLRVCLQSFN